MASGNSLKFIEVKGPLKLRVNFRENPRLAGPISSVVAADVANKLFRQTGRKSQALRRVGTETTSPRKELTDSDLDIIEKLKASLFIEPSSSDMKLLFELGRRREVRKHVVVFMYPVSP